jgi:hypothetical protein
MTVGSTFIGRNTEGSPSGRWFQTAKLRHIGAVRLVWLGPLFLSWKLR